MNSDIDISHFRQRVSDGMDRMRTMHDKRTPADQVVSYRVGMIDGIVQDAWNALLPGNLETAPAAIVAVGGYGREELNPYSDIDIMVLLSTTGNKAVNSALEPFVRFLWDVGLEVGHSVRTLSDCIRQARGDVTVVTNLLEARYCAGDRSLFDEFERKLRKSRIWPARKFYASKLKEQELRHHRYADTAYNLEPNIKEGPGGLRDIHMISWVAMRYFESRSLHDLVRREFLSEEEYQTLIKSRNFLWNLRNSLHFSLGRREDRLLFSHQIQLARQFGYVDDHNKAVEKLMKEYFRTAKEVRHLNTMMLQHFDETILARPKSRVKPVGKHFNAVDGYLDFAAPEQIEQQPEILIDIFSLLQTERGAKGIRASALRKIRASRDLIRQQFASNPRASEPLMRIMRNLNKLPEVLDKMNDIGLLGALIPEFGRVVGQLQYDLFHVYTVDAHSLFVVRNLVEFNQPESEDQFPLAHSIMKRIVKPERLYIAGLFHDLSKGQGGDHSVLGETQSYKFCKRVGMSEYDAHFVSWLVRHHLAMSFTSQREDLNDSEVISRFAAKVGDQEHLDNLYLLTVADMRGTGPSIWNDWKGKMLEHALLATSRALLIDSPLNEDVELRINEIRSDARAALGNSTSIASGAKRFWSHLDDDYFLCHDADTIAWHAQMASSAGIVDLPVVGCRKHPAIKVVQNIVVAPAFEDLFTIITSVLDRRSLNVVEARIHPLSIGLIAFTFVILSPEAIQWASARNLQELENDIRKSIILRQLEHTPPTVTRSRAARHVAIPTTVTFTQSPAKEYTMMEVSASDRPGMLYLVARTLLDFRIRLLSAKITTSGARAEDIFFIVDRDDNPITNLQLQQELTSTIRGLLHESVEMQTQSA